MGKTLPKKLRVKWDALIETEGKKLGLENCRPFLENKMVNDIFYTGLYNDIPCVVKCSSRAPKSIVNEYEMSLRLHSCNPCSCAKPLSMYVSKDGRMAFVVFERLSGPSLSELIERKFNNDKALMTRVAEDMLRIARALNEADIVWRDIFSDNFMMGEDGHIRLIDAQFAVARKDFKEAPYLVKHWKYRISVFAHNESLNGHGWNDVHMMLYCLRHLPALPQIESIRKELAELMPSMLLVVETSVADVLRACIFLCELYVRLLFSRRTSKRSQLRKRVERVRRYLRGCSLRAVSTDGPS